jgi:D-alanyl-D-alanine carboxypeptidase (penicillin-binding protein 5/6)
MTLSQRLRSIVFTVFVTLSLLIVPASAQDASELKINSSRYIVIDANSGYVFAQRDANERVAIASVTKMFTAVQAVEMAPLDTIIVTKDSDLRAPDGSYFGANGTHMGLEAGQEYTLEDMLYGMLLPSGNDAANAIARSLGYQEGDTDEQAIQRFLDLLNQRVADMGLENTHFMNAHGWGVEGHYSTAADVATFGRLVENYPTIMTIMGTSSYTTSNGYLTVTNTNRSLNLYPSVVAGKTGYDWDSGYCLINFASRDDSQQVIAVTLGGIGDGSDWYDDNATLLDYGFERQAQLATSGEAFEGDILEFNDPAPVEIVRSTTSSASFSEGDSLQQVEEDSPQKDVVPPSEPVEDEQALPERIQAPTIWAAAFTAIGLIVIRGLVTLRSPRGSASDDEVASSNHRVSTIRFPQPDGTH